MKDRDFTSWLFETLQIWRKTHALRDEMGSLARAKYEPILSNEVDQQLGYPGANVLLPRRLHAMGLNPQILQQAKPALYRDLQDICSKCRSWCRCERDLARGDRESGVRDYCLIDIRAIG